jgi:hypothetical protein
VLENDFRRFLASYLRPLPIPYGDTERKLRQEEPEFQEILEKYYASNFDSDEVSEARTFLSYLGGKMTSLCSESSSLNLYLPDYLTNYDDGRTLADCSPMPVSGIADSILAETTETRENLRVGSVAVEREGSEVTISLPARYKPADEGDYETDRWGHTETDLEPALRVVDLEDAQAALVAAFVPYAVREASGFAGFRETATKTNSLVDRLEALTLPN